MQVLEIDKETKDWINKVIAHAEANPFSINDMLNLMNNKGLPAGDREGFGLEIKEDFRVVFSIENHPGGLYKHLSVSHKGLKPAKWALEFIMKEFLFKNSIEKCVMWVEKYVNAYKENIEAVNILELIPN